MAKRSRKRRDRYKKDQSGCMWGLISIFDFRQGRSSQKLLPDRKHGSRRIDEAAYANIKLESLADSCKISDETKEAVQSEISTIDTAKMSVKELMEEEMFGEQDHKQHESIVIGEAKKSAAGDGGHVKKNRRWTKSKMSLDLDVGGFVPAGDLVAEKPSHRKHRSCSSVDLNVMVEELCSQIQQKNTNWLKHGQGGKLGVQPTEDPSAIEKELGKAIKVLVNHFTDGKCGTTDGTIQHSKELTDALQLLNSNKELFLKLLQDSNSQLVKHLRSLQDIQVDEGKLKVLMGSDLLGQDIGNDKQHSFFWRRLKGLERNSSKKSDASEDLSKIVVLKPSTPSSRNSDMASACSSLLESPRSMGDKGQIERVTSPFSFAEFKRKFKNAMRKEQHAMSHQPSDKQLNLAHRDKKVGGETAGMASPRRDHFFIEKIPKTSVGIRKMGKTGKLKDDSAVTPEQRVSNIYIEAKKHLAEIVGNSDVDVDTLDRKMPWSLGRILAFSGYSSPTICSPRMEGEMRLSPNVENQTGDEKTSQDMQEIGVSLQGQVKQELESEPCIAADKTIHEAEVHIIEPHILDALPSISDIDEPTYESEVPTPAVTLDIVISPAAESQKESDLMEISFESCEEVDNPSTGSEENSPSTSLTQDTCEENICRATENIEDLDTVSDATSRPSPISVLEPLFKEDDVSPPGIKYLTADESIRPRQIRFEEEISAPSEQTLYTRACTCTGDDKYNVEFVKAVVQMSGLTWDELLRRFIFSDHLIDPLLLDEVDFLPDLLSCDFNLLFDLVNEVLIEICRLNFGCALSFAAPHVQPELMRKDIFADIWKGVDCYLKLEGLPRTLDQILAKDFAKDRLWIDLQLDCESIGIQMQEAILEDLVEDTILSCVAQSIKGEFAILSPAESKEIEVSVEL